MLVLQIWGCTTAVDKRIFDLDKLIAFIKREQD